MFGRDKERGMHESSEGIQIQPQPQHPDITKWQLDSSDPFEKIIQYLKGYAWVEKKGKGQWERVTSAVLNDQGIHVIRTFLYSTGNKIQYLSDFSSKEVSLSLRELRTELAWTLLVNSGRYDLDKRDIPLLVNDVMQVVHAGVKRSDGGGERKFITQAGQRITKTTTSGESGSSRKGGLLSSLFGGD